ncbi:NAD(P)-dependent oxidoreductase [Phenylobacterium sp.]|jgi:citronellol/citronellal dehydrogenase|uniref:SDR family oxidoreductase n=1 Tax=Phenylobacterium sp. TaxID=1871053 RepID=UPI002F406C39
MDLRGKTLFITGASRGIGLAIALRAARDGANVAIAAKTVEPHAHLPGTIHTAADQIRAAGGQALPLVVDVRDEASILAGVARTVETFGGVDICINNASAVSLSRIGDTEAKRFDLMHQVNGRGAFLTSKACLPHLLKAGNPHILTLAPPLNMDPKWFVGHVAYTMSKYAMSMCTLGMAAELRGDGVAVNALWPRVGVATAAIEFAFADRSELARCRKPEIMGDAAHAILTRPARDCSGNFFIDDEVLHEAGVRDFDVYRVDPSVPPRVGMFLPDDSVPPPGVDMTGASRPVRA